MIAYDDAVDIGYGRGRLAPDAAASLARVDAQLGRALDINEAWRSPDDANANAAAYQAWLAYQNGSGPLAPWAPLGLPADQSVHCKGEAIDTDDTDQVALLNANGWYQTVYRDRQLIEPWHFEYFPEQDTRPALTPTALERTPMSALRIISSPYYRAAQQQVIHNGSVAKPIPNVVAAALRQGGVESKDYDDENNFNAELAEVWALGATDRAEMAKVFGERLSGGSSK